MNVGRSTRRTGGARLGAVETDYGVVVNPREELLVESLEDLNVLSVIGFHNPPTLRITFHAPGPQGHAFVLFLSVYSYVLSDVVHFVRQ